MDKGEVGRDEEMENNKGVEVEGGESDVVISIEKMLTELPPINTECFLYQAPKRLLKMNKTAYTPHPQLISIGPFHHGQPELKAMEQYKLRALKCYLQRLNMRVEEAMSMAWRWEKKVRSCYAQPIYLNNDDFVKMILLDGCFILEFMNIKITHFYGKTDDKRLDHSLFNGMWYDLQRDITMLENQLPFFVLQDLFELVYPHNNNNKDSAVYLMERMAHLFIGSTNPYKFRSNLISSTQKIQNLVDLLRLYYIPSTETEEYNKFIETKGSHFIHPPTLTELCEAGVKVQRAEQAKSLMDFSFQNGVLKIPPFKIHYHYEMHMRNLMASEIFRKGGNDKYIVHYLAFLDGLINTETDVSILVKEKILTNTMSGNDEQVSKIINNLRLNAPAFPTHYYYYSMTRDLDDYCNKWWHRSMASLRRDYFNTPWSSISFVAATFLVLLTFLQTLFSAPSIFHN